MKIATLLAALTIWAIPVAHADVGGEVPSPGLCDYPFIGHSEMIGAGPFTNVFIYVCDGPMEINGSHWHAELAGDVVQAAVQAGISMMFVNASASASGNLGAIGGTTSYRCPDNTLADWPNPPGAWKNWIDHSIRCKSIGPVPPPLGLAPPGVATVTNPGNPNPLAIENPQK